MDENEVEDGEEDEDFNLTEWLEDWFGCLPAFEGATIARQINQTYTTLWIIQDFIKVLVLKEGQERQTHGACRDCGVDTAWIEIPVPPETEDKRKNIFGPSGLGADGLGAWGRHPVHGLRMCTKCWNTRNGPTCERCGLVMDAGEEVKSGDRYLCKECDKQELEFQERKKQ